MVGAMLHLSVTCPDLDTARSIARAALEARLVACANILPGVAALYRWQGEIVEDGEVLMVFKTTEAQRATLTTLILETHPYDLPVLTWEAVHTTGAAARWLSDEIG